MAQSRETLSGTQGRIVFDHSMYRRPSRRPALVVALCIVLVVAVVAVTLVWRRLDSERNSAHYRYAGPLLPLQLLTERPEGLRAARELAFDLRSGEAKAQVSDRYGLAVEESCQLRFAYPWNSSLVDLIESVPQATLSERNLATQILPGSRTSSETAEDRRTHVTPENWEEFVSRLASDRPMLDRVGQTTLLDQDAVAAALLPEAGELKIHCYKFDYSPAGNLRTFQGNLLPETTAVIVFGAEDVRYNATHERLTVSTRRRGEGYVRIYCVGLKVKNARLSEMDAANETRVRNSRLRESEMPLCEWRLPLAELLAETERRETDRLLALTQRAEESRDASLSAAETTATESGTLFAAGDDARLATERQTTVTETKPEPTWENALEPDRELEAAWFERLRGSRLLTNDAWLRIASQRFLHEAVVSWLQHHGPEDEATGATTTGTGRTSRGSTTTDASGSDDGGTAAEASGSDGDGDGDGKSGAATDEEQEAGGAAGIAWPAGIAGAAEGAELDESTEGAEGDETDSAIDTALDSDAEATLSETKATTTTRRSFPGTDDTTTYFGLTNAERRGSGDIRLIRLPDSLTANALLDSVLLDTRLNYLCFDVPLSSTAEPSQLDIRFLTRLSQNVATDRRLEQRAIFQREEREVAERGLARRLDRIDFVPVAGSSLALTGFTGRLTLPSNMVVDQNNVRLVEGSTNQRFTVPGGPQCCRIDLLSMTQAAVRGTATLATETDSAIQELPPAGK
ncbi:MAG: hypothetical protein QM296_11405 [Bacillota bacterium]|nr:hypothetical protein [Bacillota bacterium]